jgi:hypothetical protein
VSLLDRNERSSPLSEPVSAAEGAAFRSLSSPLPPQKSTSFALAGRA